MLVVRGNNVFPSAVEGVIREETLWSCVTCVATAVALAATMCWVPYRRYARAGPWQVSRGDDGVARLEAGTWMPADAALVAGYRPSWRLARDWAGPAGVPRAESIVVAGEFIVWLVVVMEQALILSLAGAVGVRLRRAWRSMARVG